MFSIISEDFDIEKIAESGQCFRITREQAYPDKWRVIAGEKLAYILHCPDGAYTLECMEEDNSFWRDYFDLETDYGFFRRSVDPCDTFLESALEYGRGIRILRQDPWEMLITFIISQRRSIPSIRTCVERICKRWGKRLKDGIYAFPSPSALVSAGTDGLLECGLGYRAEYVYFAAREAAAGDIDFEELKKLSDEELLRELLSLRGVGPKVANCVSLFGFYRIAAFPVDVWIDRVQKTYYGGHFPAEHYKGYAGIMQQYIFYYARNGKNKL